MNRALFALTLTLEDSAPSFEHHVREALPSVTHGGATLTLVTGHGFGLTSPVSGKFRDRLAVDKYTINRPGAQTRDLDL